MRVLVGRVGSDDMIRLDQVKPLRVACRQSYLMLAIDGETARLRAPLDSRIRGGALIALAPPKTSVAR